MELNEWMAQIRKGTLDLLVLSLLRENQMYGLEIINLLKDEHGVELAEGTLYPLMNRLRNDGAVLAKWDYNAGTGHPRKYYTLTKKGRETVAEMHRNWLEYVQTIEAVVVSRGVKRTRTNAKEA